LFIGSRHVASRFRINPTRFTTTPSTRVTEAPARRACIRSLPDFKKGKIFDNLTIFKIKRQSRSVYGMKYRIFQPARPIFSRRPARLAFVRLKISAWRSGG
jgi:hypothetical protein